MSVLKIFVSHSSTYADLARSFKLSLHALETTTVLDIKISEEMAGATDWRRWIDITCEPPTCFSCYTRMRAWKWAAAITNWDASTTKSGQ